MGLGGPLEYCTFWTITAFFSPVFRPPFESRAIDTWTQIYHSNTRLVRYLDGYCICMLGQNDRRVEIYHSKFGPQNVWYSNDLQYESPQFNVFIYQVDIKPLSKETHFVCKLNADIQSCYFSYTPPPPTMVSFT